MPGAMLGARDVKTKPIPLSNPFIEESAPVSSVLLLILPTFRFSLNVPATRRDTEGLVPEPGWPRLPI